MYFKKIVEGLRDSLPFSQTNSYESCEKMSQTGVALAGKGDRLPSAQGLDKSLVP